MASEDGLEDKCVSVLLPGEGKYKLLSVKPAGKRLHSQGSIVAKVRNEDLNTLVSIPSPTSGCIVKVLASVDDTLTGGDCLLQMQPCQHSIVIKDLCAECGTDLRTLADVFNSPASVSIVHHVPELKVSKKEAQDIGKEDRGKLLATKKLILLVDLDHTLVHTTELDVDPNSPAVHHYQLWSRDWYHTKVRPHLQHFLEKVHDLFEMHVFTFGARLYAHTVSRILDPDGKYFEHRIVSRDELFNSTSKMGNIKSLFPCGDEMVCIIDDRIDVWDHAMNLIHVKPYIYFKHAGFVDRKWEEKAKESDASPEDSTISDKQTAEETSDVTSESNTVKENKNESPEAKKDEERDGKDEEDEEDDYLLHLEDILRRIHTEYFQQYVKPTDSIPDLKKIIPKIRSTVLAGVRLVFSGVIPRTANPVAQLNHPAYVTARSLGATIMEHLKEEVAVTHVVAASLDTQKVKQARKIGNVKVVSVEWLWSCAERWEWVEEALFPLKEHVLEDINKEGVWRGSHKTYDDKPVLNTQMREEMMDEVDAYLAEGSSDEGDEEDNDKDNCQDDDDNADTSSSSSVESLSGPSHPKGWKEEAATGSEPATRTCKRGQDEDDEIDKHSGHKRLCRPSDIVDENSATNDDGDDDERRSNDSFEESVGSVDEEMADALEDLLDG